VRIIARTPDYHARSGDGAEGIPDKEAAPGAEVSHKGLNWQRSARSCNGADTTKEGVEGGAGSQRFPQRLGG
jgi:hypothetical protein